MLRSHIQLAHVHLACLNPTPYSTPEYQRFQWLFRAYMPGAHAGILITLSSCLCPEKEMCTRTCESEPAHPPPPPVALFKLTTRSTLTGVCLHSFQ